jgi:hypothetical protein
MGDPDEIGAHLDWLTLASKNILKRPDHWLIVQALATELLERRVVRAKRARALMRDAWRKAVEAWAATPTPGPESWCLQLVCRMSAIAKAGKQKRRPFGRLFVSETGPGQASGAANQLDLLYVLRSPPTGA